MIEKPAAAPEPAFKKSVAREYLESIVVAVILALFIRTFAIQAFKIPTGSMEPNLLIGDHLLVNKLVYSPSLAPWEDKLFGKKPIRRGDVVVFKYPEEP
jgi:signal peptidase I